MTDPVYLDHNAGAPLRPAVRAAMAAAMDDACGNPSSVHGFGRRARHRLESAREAVAALVQSDPGSVLFTGSGSEANNLALSYTDEGAYADERPRCPILRSAIEHESVLQASPDARVIPVTGEGLIDMARLEAMLAVLKGRKPLVSVMAANNETGVIQPIAEIADLVHRHGGVFHCDAVQAAGRLPLDMAGLGIDLLTLSAHKLGGPPGVGALIAAPCHLDRLTGPRIRGGAQERGRRAGTENLLGIIGFGAAAGAAADDLADQPRLAALRDGMEARILALPPTAAGPVRIAGRFAPRLANTSCLVMPGVAAEIQVMAFDLAGLAVSAGAACSAGKVTPSHVLAAMGLDAESAASAIRVSLGAGNDEADLERFVDIWRDLSGRKLRSGKNRAA